MLVLTFYAEQNSVEIGRELAMNAENVRAIRHRALASLRDCVKGVEA